MPWNILSLRVVPSSASEDSSKKGSAKRVTETPTTLVPVMSLAMSVADNQSAKTVNSVPLASRNLASPALLASVNVNEVPSLLSYFALLPSCRYTLPASGKPYVPQDAKSVELLLSGFTPKAPPPLLAVARLASVAVFLLVEKGSLARGLGSKVGLVSMAP